MTDVTGTADRDSREVRDVAASVRARLTNEARRAGRPFQEVLTHFTLERFLYRLSRSPHDDRLKDFYDVRLLAQRFPFDATTLGAAVGATFDRRAPPPRRPAHEQHRAFLYDVTMLVILAAVLQSQIEAELAICDLGPLRADPSERRLVLAA